MGGTKELASVGEIKKELMENGPVVSTSFVLDEAFMATTGRHTSHSPFLRSRIGKEHELLIVGWKLTTLGEAWLVMPVKTKSTTSPVQIAFGQFGIDEECLAPPEDAFTNAKWQSGPSFDREFPSASWITKSTMTMSLSDSEMHSLAECFDGTGLYEAINAKMTFLIRQKNKIARSRKYTLNEFQWDKNKSVWNVTVTKVHGQK